MDTLINTTVDTTMIALGGEVKALGDGRVGGYILSFGSPERRDLYGDYFTKSTEFGYRKGLHSDVYIHHRFPLLLGSESPEEKAALENLAARSVGHLDVVRMDDVGIWAEHVLDMADDYQRKIYEMVQAGKLKYSTGTSPHLYNRDKSGEIKTWVIAEASLTPTPAEWRTTNVVVPIRSLSEAFATGLTPEQFQAAVQESLRRIGEPSPSEPSPEAAADLAANGLTATAGMLDMIQDGELKYLSAKAALLGDSIESDITLGAIERLFWQFQWSLWSCLSGNALFATASIEQRVAYAGALVDEFSQIAKRVIGGINLSGDTAELATVAKAALTTLENVKAGRILSTKNERDIRTAVELLLAVLKQVEEEDDTTASATTKTAGTLDEIRSMLTAHVEQYEADKREEVRRSASMTSAQVDLHDTTTPPVNLTTGLLTESLRRVTLAGTPA